MRNGQAGRAKVRMPQTHAAFPSLSGREEGWILMTRDASVKTPPCVALCTGQKNDPA